MKLLNVLSRFGFDGSRKTRMARHKDTRHGVNFKKLLDSGQFEDYQAWQSKKAYRDAEFVVSFVGDRGNLARFWGVYSVVGVDVIPANDLPQGMLWPWKNNEPHYFYHLQRLPTFDPLADRLVIDWDAPRCWVQWLKNNNVVECPPLTDLNLHAWDSLYPEGAPSAGIATRRFRSRLARQECLKIYKSRCSVCEMSFPEQYNGLGEGFMHVHHLTELSKRLGQYGVSPRHDLRPVCPNCHAMLHWNTSKPRSITKLRKLLGMK